MTDTTTVVETALIHPETLRLLGGPSVVVGTKRGASGGVRAGSAGRRSACQMAGMRCRRIGPGCRRSVMHG